MRTILFLGWLLAIVATAQSPNSNRTTLRGGGLEVDVDLTGWTQTEGPAVFHGTYVRLGQFVTKFQVLSLLVDQPPPGTDLQGVCEHAVQSYSTRTGLKILEQTTVAGKAACLFMFPDAGQRRNLYVEMLFEDRWLELHYSAPDVGKSVELGRQALEPVVASLSAKRYEDSPGDLQQPDITDSTIAFVEYAQGCGAKSKDFICLALAAFKAGTRPSGRPSPVGIAGISVPVIFDKALDAAAGLRTTAGFIVLSDTAVRLDHLPGKLSKEQEKAAKEVISAVKAGRQPPGGNLIAAAARSATETHPAALAERSMIVPSEGPGKLYLRETAVGLVCVGLLPGPQGAPPMGILLEIYPTQ